MPALSRRSFVTLTALASSSILLSPRAFAGSGATSAAGKPQETFLDFNESPYGPSAKARAAMQQAAALCGRYDYDAQDALVGLFAKQNGIPAECVHAYCGSRQPLQYAVAAFTGKERSLVMADPSYDSVLGAAQAQGAKVAAVPLDAEAAHDIERMLAAAQRDAGLIYICNPNNPTGTLTPHERIVRAIERKPKRSVVLVDEAYIHFSDAPSVVGLAVQ
ncbi:MAG TPA: aminotransferase class I/II-fold pyridoxal phosphate-dependent enzyme, partial [Pseudomonas aeruginosa]|nr:aminotransferase class I/II-fold pyridoxal phosphate-dependent enzyme [Pseudomonas aeruginosa]